MEINLLESASVGIISLTFYNDIFRICLYSTSWDKISPFKIADKSIDTFNHLLHILA